MTSNFSNAINLSEICDDYGSFKVHRFEGSKVLLFITCGASFYLHIRRTSEPLEPSEPFLASGVVLSVASS